MSRVRFATLAVAALASAVAAMDMTTLAGARAALPSKLKVPSGVASLASLDGEGTLSWVADTQNNRIQFLDADGEVTTVAGSGSFGFGGDAGAAMKAKLSWPHGVAVRPLTCDPVSNTNDVALYIADTYNHRVRVVTEGRIETLAGNGRQGVSGDGGKATAARLSHPHAVAVLAADCSTHTPAAEEARAKSGVVVFIADTYNNRIRRIDADGIITTVAGTGASAFAGDNGAAVEASLAWPMGLTVLPSARTEGGVVMVIADTYNQRVRLVDADGMISTLAGNGKEGFSQDSLEATSVSLSHPTGVTAVRATPETDDVTVWFTDSSSHRVRQLTHTGVLTTLAGKSWAGYKGDHGAANDAVLNQPKGISAVASSDLKNMRLVFTDSFNHAVRAFDTSAKPASDRDEVELRWVRVLQTTVEPTPTVTPTVTPTPSSVATSTPSATASHTPSNLPSSTPSMSNLPSAAPSIQSGSRVVQLVIVLANVSCTTDAAAAQMRELIRVSISVKANLNPRRVHVRLVGIVLCTARRLQASGASDVQVLVSIDASATQEDPVVLDATELAANLTSVPAATLLETFVSSSLAASLGVTESSVTLESAPVVTTTSAPADSGLSGGGIAGIVIAVVVVAAIIAIAAVVVIKRKKNRGHVAPDATPMTSPAPTSVSQV